MKIACSYNPNFIISDDLLQPDVELMEVGLTAYRRVFSREKQFTLSYENDISVHISRSPITEARYAQDIFIEEKLAPLYDDDRVISIGFHLCGERRNNIGKLGFSSHYNATDVAERQAVGFITSIRNHSGKKVWIENANFYSTSAREIFKTWKSIAAITDESDAGLIIDLSHLIIDSHNARIPAEAAIGLIPWDKVVEVHLSGIITGKDGAMHDSHGTPVASAAWKLLEELLSSRLISEATYVNIEHSDEEWEHSVERYKADFDNLRRIQTATGPEKEVIDHSTRYAENYLKKILKSTISNWPEIVEEDGRSEIQLLSDWLTYIDKQEKRISLSEEELDSEMKKSSVYFIDSFSDFVNLKTK